ncbi:hypothetical protein F4821DRAFT_259553 [Hypoxylon rubiginosum]|uniref:Uncharacterized protein n=1 Tax=Hypoxylon rubiginosum TaxID=110542 RepID=A0ACC0D237_9PEZI|nr:hypothetical protein F4821DRAFT_259553 [Hypoxylon rubiginosum]
MAITNIANHSRSSSDSNLDDVSSNPSSVSLIPSSATSRVASVQELRRQETGQIVLTRFIPPSKSSMPLALFPSTMIRDSLVPKWRFISWQDPKQFLIFVGASVGLTTGQRYQQAS